ncbi:MAG: DinB family protein [Cellulophaga sp.]
MTTSEVQGAEYNSYYKRYIDLVGERSLKEGFEIGENTTVNFFKAIPEDKLEYRYAEGKWSIKEVLQHIVDTERVFMYRCFRIARRDKTALAGFDQDLYIEPSNADQKSLDALLEEYIITRKATSLLVTSLTDDDLRFLGVASDSIISARAAAFIIQGHEIWHMNIIKERYL